MVFANNKKMMYLLKIITIFIGIVTVVSGQNVNLNNENKIINEKESILRNGDGYNDDVCDAQLSAFFSALMSGEFWAMNIFDSWGKVPSGIFSGNLVELGSFDQCLNVNHDTTQIENVGTFKGQYCLASVNILSLLPSPIGKNLNITRKIFPEVIDTMNMTNRLLMTGSLGLSQGICVPSACSPSYLQQALEQQTGTPLFQIRESMCQQKEKPVYNVWDIVTIFLVAKVALLMVCSTMYDLLMNWRNEKPTEILIAFSMYTNGEKIFKCTKSKSDNVMDCIHGIRSLSIIWVVFGHTYLTTIMKPSVNIFEITNWSQSFFSMTILGATVSVDSFFVLSGLLVTWSVLRELDRSRGRLNIFMMYFHRYIRLTPSLVFAVLFFVTLSEHIVSGPLRPLVFSTNNPCREYWWSTLLYIQNYVNPNGVCLGQSWYLSVDMQLFILSPIILYPLWRWKNKFVWVIPLLIVLSMGCVFATFMKYDFSIEFNNPNNINKQEKTYLPTHARYGPYLVGVLLGYLLHIIKGKSIYIPKVVVFAAWVISIGSVFVIVFGIYPVYQSSHTTTTLESAFFEPFSRVGWGICLAWIIFACVHGYGGPINWFLSLPQWQPIGRLSYSIYLVHMPIQLMLSTSAKTTSYFSDVNSIHAFWGDFGLTLTVAVLWTLAFESPILTLEKILLGSRKPCSKPAEQITPKDTESTVNFQNGQFRQNNGQSEQV